MRSPLRSLVAIVIGAACVSAVAAKPPELPNRPLVELKVPLFPLGEEQAEQPLAPPQPAAPPQVQPEREPLLVMPRQIEPLNVTPGIWTVSTNQPLGIDVIAAWANHFASQDQVPCGSWMALTNPDRPEWHDGPSAQFVAEHVRSLRVGMPESEVLALLRLEQASCIGMAGSMQCHRLRYSIEGIYHLGLSFERDEANGWQLQGYNFDWHFSASASVWNRTWCQAALGSRSRCFLP
jgi:hypothetical protein